MLQIDFDKLQQAYNIRGMELQLMQNRVVSLEAENARLKELLKLQQERIFGKSSETSNSLNVFNPEENNNLPSNILQPQPDPHHTKVSAHFRKIPTRGNRQFNSCKLPKYTVIHDLPEIERICACCGNQLHLIGQDISEQLEIIPVQYCTIEHVRLKYGCRPCDSIVMAPKPQDPLPKAIAGPGLLTDVILNKYQYHLPLYRQSKIMQSHTIIAGSP